MYIHIMYVYTYYDSRDIGQNLGLDPLQEALQSVFLVEHLFRTVATARHGFPTHTHTHTHTHLE
jgi:hypothetical protein